jgi:hypothetical protein
MKVYALLSYGLNDANPVVVLGLRGQSEKGDQIMDTNIDIIRTSGGIMNYLIKHGMLEGMS